MATTQTFGPVLPMRSRLADITYWAITGLFALSMVASGLIDISHNPEFMGALTRLGYPSYLATMLGIAKFAGALAVVLPVGRSIREWAYAGFIFDLLGASLSHAIIGDPAVAQAGIAFAVVLCGASYVLWRRRITAAG